MIEGASNGLQHDEIANGSMYNSGIGLGLKAILDTPVPTCQIRGPRLRYEANSLGRTPNLVTGIASRDHDCVDHAISMLRPALVCTGHRASRSDTYSHTYSFRV